MESSKFLKYMALLVGTAVFLFFFTNVSQVKVSTPFCKLQTNCKPFQSAKGTTTYGFPLSSCNNEASPTYFVINEKHIQAYLLYLCANNMQPVKQHVQAIHCSMKKGNATVYTEIVKQYAATIENNSAYHEKVMAFLENKM